MYYDSTCDKGGFNFVQYVLSFFSDYNYIKKFKEATDSKMVGSRQHIYM